MSKVVYAKETTRLMATDGLSYLITTDQPWAADDPLVRRHPSFFSDEPVSVMRTVHPVEQATHGPGEVREMQRGRR